MCLFPQPFYIVVAIPSAVSINIYFRSPWRSSANSTVTSIGFAQYGILSLKHTVIFKNFCRLSNDMLRFYSCLNRYNANTIYSGLKRCSNI